MKADNTAELAEIREKLKYGDRKIIAQLAGCSLEMVKKVLSGKRNHRKGKGAKIVEVALKVIEVRKTLKKLR